MIAYLFLTFFLSFLCSFFVTVKAKKRNMFLSDHLHTGPQKFHTSPTPRIGGLGIFVALIGAAVLTLLRGEGFSKDFILLTLCALPAFLAGFVEDISGKFSSKLRLIVLSSGAALAYFLLDAAIRRVDLPVDFLLGLGIISFLFTVFAVVGITNAINIIDGFNGLASMVSVIILLALGYVSYKVGDYFLIISCIALVGAIVGFFILNYPAGLIFLGDGGAYMLGFLIGVNSILLVNRHPEVSPWFPLVVCIYPVFEVLFSIYRRVFIKKTSPFKPDTLHLHTVIYRRLINKIVGKEADPLRRNYTTSPFLWVLSCLGVVPGLLWWNNTVLLIFSAILFALIYICLYWRILMGRLPKFRS